MTCRISFCACHRWSRLAAQPKNWLYRKTPIRASLAQSNAGILDEFGPALMVFHHQRLQLLGRAVLRLNALAFELFVDRRFSQRFAYLVI